ncbi:MAG TPA: 7TM diverse intracellular signaling domain-containing protein [Parafilimonas sp.]|nr:7TM diverse intracellular signaling domain-containing protein [Parafilimonas sp.]
MQLIKIIRSCILTLYVVFLLSPALAAEPILFSNPSRIVSVGKNLEILEDKEGKYDERTIMAATGFHISTNDVPLFPIPDVNVWLRFSVTNNSSLNAVYLFIEHFNVSKITLYKAESELKPIYVDGNALHHPADNSLPAYIKNLSLAPGTSGIFYMHVESVHPVVFSTYVGSQPAIQEEIKKQIFTVSVYVGIVAAVFLYNLFLFFPTRDRNYFLYIMYVFCLGFAQLTLAGYPFKFLWLSQPSLNYYAVPVTSCLAGVFGILFSIQFLRTNFYTPVLHKILIATAALYALGIVFSLAHNNKLSYDVLDYNTPVVGILSIIAAFIVTAKGYRPALYYAISWLFFLAGLIVFSLRNIDVLPSNSFTTYILFMGSSIEAVLLSIALADKINTLKKEKEQSQAEALQKSRENEQLVREQNVMLEQKVVQRTQEIQEANNQLSDALNNLKDTQTQLVEAEKMASLGQLTAGIAHEINNPINFVKSNINPLRLDVKDLLDVLHEYSSLHSIQDGAILREKLSKIESLKEDIDVELIQKEIHNLILGIEEGAERTAEIVRGLRTFSRLDEAALKTVNIHDGIVSTLVLLKNSIPYNIKVEKEFNARGNIECFPGKLNQVFMNILTNAIHAIKAKQEKEEEGFIWIKTRDVNNDSTEISIKDTGVGMTEEVKRRVYEPFFTTKEVGEGTGLGMAIAFKIIEKHAGKIEIVSSPCAGAEFIITLPNHHPVSDHL